MAEQTADDVPTVLVVMGVSGTGKSTVAGMLADRLGWDLAEGDDLHPPANVEKMRAGTPLTDEDRWPWLDKVAAWIRAHTDAGTPGIITCSALRRIYRDRLSGPGVVFVHLAGHPRGDRRPDVEAVRPLHAAEPAGLPAGHPGTAGTR